MYSTVATDGVCMMSLHLQPPHILWSLSEVIFCGDSVCSFKSSLTCTRVSGLHLMILEPLLLPTMEPWHTACTQSACVCVCVYMSKLDTQANMWAIYILYSQVVCTSLVWVVSECVLCCYVSFVLSQCSLYDPTCSHVTFSLRLSLCWIMETLTADKGLNIMEIMALTLPLHRPAELFTYIFLPLNEEVLILFQSVENISAQL